jgi:hypothetical protein
MKAIDFGAYITVTTELFDALNHAGLLAQLTTELPAGYYDIDETGQRMCRCGPMANLRR